MLEELHIFLQSLKLLIYTLLFFDSLKMQGVAIKFIIFLILELDIAFAIFVSFIIDFSLH